jgi:hypothetical protein
MQNKTTTLGADTAAAAPVDALVRPRCDRCGRDKIIATIETTGGPSGHVAGPRVEYCGSCDEAPVMVLQHCYGATVVIRG